MNLYWKNSWLIDGVRGDGVGMKLLREEPGIPEKALRIVRPGETIRRQFNFEKRGRSTIVKKYNTELILNPRDFVNMHE